MVTILLLSSTDRNHTTSSSHILCNHGNQNLWVGLYTLMTTYHIVLQCYFFIVLSYYFSNYSPIFYYAISNSIILILLSSSDWLIMLNLKLLLLLPESCQLQSMSSQNNSKKQLHHACWNIAVTPIVLRSIVGAFSLNNFCLTHVE